MNYKFLFLIFILNFILIYSSKNYPIDYSYFSNYVDKFVQDSINKFKVNGLSISLVHNNEIVYIKNYGYSDYNKSFKIDNNTIYRCGSISKTLTALAIMRLYEENKIDIDKPINYYIPEFKMLSRFKNTNNVTIRHLLSHKSGIMRDYYSGIMGNSINEEIIWANFSNEYYCYPPEYIHKYSNIGYFIPGKIIEKITKMKFEDYMYSNILVPLKMTNSSFITNEIINKFISSGFKKKSFSLIPELFKNNDLIEIPHFIIRDKAAGSLYSNIDDMINYLLFLINDKDNYFPHIISNSTFSNMIEIQYPDIKISSLMYFPYGLGWMINFFKFPDIIGDIISHDGDINGFASCILFSLKHKIGIVLLANTETARSARYEIISKVFLKYFELLYNTNFNYQYNLFENNYDYENISPEGKYVMPGSDIDIYKISNELYAKIFGWNFYLMHLTNNIYKPYLKFLFIPIEISSIIGFDDVYLEFKKYNNDLFLMLNGRIGYTIQTITMHKLGDCKIPENYKNYLGDWEIEINEETKPIIDYYLQGNKFELKIDSNLLYLVSKNNMANIKLLLYPITESEAIIYGSGEYVFFTNNNIYFSGIKVIKK